MSWQGSLETGTALEWPYPISYGEEKEVSTDVLVLGGGIAGCWAAIAAARKGVRVAILEKGAAIRSGSGGAGCDHWGYAITGNPCCPLTPEEVTKAGIDATQGYCNPMSAYITCREGYETLLELEQMGAKVRDTEDEFKGAEFRDEKTKLLFAYDYTNRFTIRVWGTTFKPALYNECKRLGVEIYDRVMATSLLTEGGKQGTRVVGATGINVRTGEFMVAKARATIICLARPGRIWYSSTEFTGFAHLAPPTSGGAAMAWRAGAEFTMMEQSVQQPVMNPAPCHGAGHAGNTYYACSMVDANGKEIPWVDRDGRTLKTVSERYRPAPGQKFTRPQSHVYESMPAFPVSMDELLEKGEITLPLYADLPSMPEHERRAIFGLMVGQESKTKATYKYYTEAGFDPDKDMLQGYQWAVPYSYGLSPLGRTRPGYDFPFGSRNIRRFGVGTQGGLVVDWDWKTSLDGLYAAGDSVFGTVGHPGAATTGKYAGREAADYVLKATEPVITRKQIEDEKARVYAPIGRGDGIEWKELNVAINKVMHIYCGEPKSEELMNMGLMMLGDLKGEAASSIYATDPHKLGRSLEVMDILTSAEMVIHACLERRASSKLLNFTRWDYPEMDPEEWHKFITIKLEDGKVKVGELPIGFWGSLKDNYEAHCGK